MPTLITKQAASDLGLTRFYTGRPCLRDHDSERLTNGGACIACMRENKAARSKTRTFKDRRNAQLIARRAAARQLRPCVVCQTPFDIMINNRTGAKTCSPSCSEVFREQRASERLKVPDRECENCFAMFASRNPGQRGCSPKCGIILRDARRAARKKSCLHCGKEFGCADARNGFCSDECRDARHQAHRRAAHLKLRMFNPEKIVARKARYRLSQPEAFMRTRKTINDRRVAYEVAALAVAKDMIPEALAGVRGYRAKTNMAVEFMRSLDITAHSMQPERTDDTLRQAQGRLDHSADQKQPDCI